jgi:hypothetical protein
MTSEEWLAIHLKLKGKKEYRTFTHEFELDKCNCGCKRSRHNAIYNGEEYWWGDERLPRNEELKFGKCREGHEDCNGFDDLGELVRKMRSVKEK